MAIVFNHEQYVEKLKEIHGDAVFVVGRYIKTSVKISHQCQHGHFWDSTPNNIISKKRGCPHCAGVLLKSTSVYRSEVQALRKGEVFPVDEYKGARTSILHQCQHGHTWMASPTNILKGRNCPYCSGKGKRSHQDYVKAVELVHGDQITVVGIYTNNRTKIEHRCASGHVFMGLPNTVKVGTGCPYCAGNARKTDEQYKSELYKKHQGRIRSLEAYVSSDTKILHECDHGHQFKAVPISVLTASTGCLKCVGKKLKTTEEYISDLIRVHGDRVACVGEYVNTKTHLRHRCLFQHEWSATPSAILAGSGCPFCAGQRPDDRIRANRNLGKRVRSRIYSEMKRQNFANPYKTRDSVTAYVREVLSGDGIAEDVIKIEKMYKEARAQGLTIDHIIPICFADSSNPKELELVLNIQNLRLLSKPANSQRSRNITKQEFLDQNLFTDWHLEVLLKLSYTRYYFPQIDEWLQYRDTRAYASNSIKN